MQELQITSHPCFYFLSSISPLLVLFPLHSTRGSIKKYSTMHRNRKHSPNRINHKQGELAGMFCVMRSPCKHELHTMYGHEMDPFFFFLQNRRLGRRKRSKPPIKFLKKSTKFPELLKNGLFSCARQCKDLGRHSMQAELTLAKLSKRECKMCAHNKQTNSRLVLCKCFDYSTYHVQTLNDLQGH